MSRSLTLLALVLLLAFSGCGDDEQDAAKKPRITTTHSERTAPRTETAPPTPVQTTPPPSTTSQDPATAPAPAGEGDGRPRGTPQGGSDSPQNDKPPPSGSPAERFEKECEARPQSCG